MKQCPPTISFTKLLNAQLRYIYTFENLSPFFYCHLNYSSLAVFSLLCFVLLGIFVLCKKIQPKLWLRKTSPKYKEEEQTRERFEVSSQSLKYGDKD
jgi:hypothetical protein